jgi:hypothetical protein
MLQVKVGEYWKTNKPAWLKRSCILGQVSHQTAAKNNVRCSSEGILEQILRQDHDGTLNGTLKKSVFRSTGEHIMGDQDRGQKNTDPAKLCAWVRSLASKAHRLLQATGVLPNHLGCDGDALLEEIIRLQLEVHEQYPGSDLRRWVDALRRRLEERCNPGRYR